MKKLIPFLTFLIIITGCSEKIEETGILKITGTQDAQVYIDNVLQGYTPVELTLSVGSHNVLLIKEGYRNKYKKVEIQADKITEINMALEKVTPAEQHTEELIGTWKTESPAESFYISWEECDQESLSQKLTFSTVNENKHEITITTKFSTSCLDWVDVTECWWRGGIPWCRTKNIEVKIIVRMEIIKEGKFNVKQENDDFFLKVNLKNKDIDAHISFVPPNVQGILAPGEEKRAENELKETVKENIVGSYKWKLKLDEIRHTLTVFYPDKIVYEK